MSVLEGCERVGGVAVLVLGKYIEQKLHGRQIDLVAMHDIDGSLQPGVGWARTRVRDAAGVLPHGEAKAHVAPILEHQEAHQCQAEAVAILGQFALVDLLVKEHVEGRGQGIFRGRNANETVAVSVPGKRRILKVGELPGAGLRIRLSTDVYRH